MKRRTKLVTAVGCAALVAAAVQLRPGEVTAADHAEAPAAAADAPADIADLFAWHNEDATRFYAIITFAGLGEAGGEPTYDADVLYALHIDEDMDGTADRDIYVRFGQNLLEEWGARVDNAPGEDASFEGPVGGIVAGTNGTQLWTGLADDPFFFDLEGYQMTLASIEMGAPELMFSADRDGFENTNVTAIALDLDLAALDEDGVFQVWATTARLTPR